MSKFMNALKKPQKIFLYLINKGCLDWLDDTTYLKVKFLLKMGYKLDLKNPKTYNEKLQWIKLHDRRDIYSTMVDKYEVKEYVSAVIGEKYIIPTLGVWESFHDIDFESLPNQFVLKCTHDSGGLVICKDKRTLDMKLAKSKIEKSLHRNYYLHGREWPYKNVKPKIIAEKYMVDESGYELKDYKFFCFNGKMKVMFIASDRGNPNTETKFDFFDENFNHLPFTNGHPNASREFQQPVGFDKMKELAEKLSLGIPQARIDFYNINGDIYFGEITLFHWGGLMPFEPEEWDYILGSWIELPEAEKGKKE